MGVVDDLVEVEEVDRLPTMDSLDKLFDRFFDPQSR